MEHIKNLIKNPLFLLGVILVLVILNIRSCENRKKSEIERINLANSLSDTVSTYRDKNNNLISRISVLETENANIFLKIISKENEIIELQETVRQYKNKLEQGGSVIIIGGDTDIGNTNPTVIVKVDTVYRDNIVYLYPTYKDSLKNEWIDYTTTINKDSASFNLKIYNKYRAIIGTEKGVTFVDVISENPYSSISALRAYQVSVKNPKTWSVGISAGYGISDNFKLKPFIGVGIHKSIIRF